MCFIGSSIEPILIKDADQLGDIRYDLLAQYCYESL